jgi:membrane-associated phospholipid phosphatase
VWDYSLAALSTALLVVDALVLQPERPPLEWNSPILFDSDARSAMRVSTENARDAWGTTSWALWGLQLGYPVLVDLPFAWLHYDPEVARDLFWQDAATLTVAGVIDLGLRDLVGRARPTVYDCIQRGGRNCLESVESTRSFPGGHFVNGTAASALTCTQHLYGRLYGSPWDAIACATTVASDLAIGVMRIMADRHWASDQLAGAAMGTLIGWGVPYVMHIRSHAPEATKGSSGLPARTALVIPVPVLTNHGGGLSLTGIF